MTGLQEGQISQVHRFCKEIGDGSAETGEKIIARVLREVRFLPSEPTLDPVRAKALEQAVVFFENGGVDIMSEDVVDAAVTFERYLRRGE